MNICHFIGNLGADPEVRRLASGEPVVNLRIAVSERWRNKAGEKKERTEWVPVVIFNAGLCKVAEQYLRKGSKVHITGKFQTRKWQDQSGQDRYSTEIVLNGFSGSLEMLDSPKGDNQQPRSSQQSDQGGGFGGGAGPMEDSEIPF